MSTHIDREEQLIRELSQIDPEKLPVSPPAPPSDLQIARAELELARDKIDELTDEVERLQQIENAALRVASSRRNGIVTDKNALDLLDAALEDITPAARSAS